MTVGVFAKVFAHLPLEGALDEIRAAGIRHIQFNLQCVGLPTLPDSIPAPLVARIRQALQSRDIEIAVLSGTFNLIHPENTQRRLGLQRLEVLMAHAREIGARTLSLCTGTCHPTDMWAFHPDNATPQAWDRLDESLGIALQLAKRYDVYLAIEPEQANVVSTARLGREVISAFPIPRLKAILDPANLAADVRGQVSTATVEDAVSVLAPWMTAVHVKHLRLPGSPGHHLPAPVDHQHFIRCLRSAGFQGPLILQDLLPSEVPAAARLLREYALQAA